MDTSIKKVLLIGSGPIVIGQAAEFDYSGTQACQAFKEEGISVVLVNSNPATIMTDQNMADATYIEPLTLSTLEKIIEKERPDAMIAGMGGQTGLNLSCELYDSGLLDRYNIKVIGTSINSIKQGEDRDLFKQLMEKTNQPMIESGIVNNVSDGIALADKIGYPVIVRPAYTLGGSGGGIAHSQEQLEPILTQGIHLSKIGQVLVEKSIAGYKEIEFEVLRDSYGNCVTVCSMENVDPVGVHTGDSVVVAPAQTLSSKELTMLQTAAYSIICAVGIVGGCNVQFALDPHSMKYAVIEINPRVSRSSALASKATGYPIAKVATKIALGYALSEIKNPLTGKTFACSEPVVDYVVLKIPKWPFDKFHLAKRNLGTKMMATGEVMAISNTFESALLKGIRSLEIGQYTLERASSKKRTFEELRERVQMPDDERLFDLAEMLRRHYRVEKVCEITGMDPFFVNKINNIVEMEEDLKAMELEDLDEKTLRHYKEKGFSDKGIAELMGISPEKINELRKTWGIVNVYKMVDTCAGEFGAQTPYLYSTYDTTNESVVSNQKKALVIGSGPIRIGQGIEFDYGSVHCILALKQAGYQTIMANNNPETMSTDFNTADKLYFEPLTEEDVLNIIELEKPDGVILQFGGQTAIKLAGFLSRKNVPILGTQPKYIDEAEDREKFDALLETLHIARPKGKAVWNLQEGLNVANELGFPVLVRPSYVLGGQGMEITYEKQQLTRYLEEAFQKDSKNPVLIDRYIDGRELEVDAICDGVDVFIPGIMEHLEQAGVHSGDSISLYPPRHVSPTLRQEILDMTKKISLALNVKGMVNIQFIEKDGNLFIIEVNPRSSRTVPYVSKMTNVPIIYLATHVMLGKSLQSLGYGSGIGKEPSIVSVKVPMFSTEKLPQVEVSLGPEMRSTGEVLGVSHNWNEALLKGFLAANWRLPKQGEYIVATIRDRDHEAFIPLAKRFVALGFCLYATKGTKLTLDAHGVSAKLAEKISEGSPNILDIMRKGNVGLVIDLPKKSNVQQSDGFIIRRTAAETGVLLLSCLDTVTAMLDMMESGVCEQQLVPLKLTEL